MKISSVTTSSFRLHSAFNAEPLDAHLIELHAGSISGCAVALTNPDETVAVAQSLLIGADALATSALWEQLVESNASPEIRAGLDIALWDLKARTANEPLWRMLGGSRTRVNVHLNSGSASQNDAAIDAFVDDMVRRHGFRGVVLESSNDAERDLDRLRFIDQCLRTVTREPALMIRTTERTTTEVVATHIQALERSIDLTAVELPTPIENVAGLKNLSDSIRAAVCAGGSLASPRAYFPCLQERAVDVVQIDIARCGITGALQIADAAFGFELPVAIVDSIGNIAAHVATAMPNCMSMEVRQPRYTGAVSSDVKVDDGWAIAGDTPGHGLRVSASALTHRSHS